jgi:ABC-type nitrate/sulfonate/bicarbonate transport system substrate-binding protein
MHVLVMHLMIPLRPVLLLCALALLAEGLCPLAALDKAVLYIGWRAEPECGGFFQALTTGIYKKYGLDTEIQLGSPQANAEIFLSMNKVDFIEGSSSDAINFLRQEIPVEAVGAMFQKSPRVLIAHAGQGNDTLEAMKGKPVWIGAQALVSAWPFLKARYGFSDDQIRPYTFNEAPFLANPRSIQEGYLTEEPYALRKVGVTNPVVIMLSDHGFQGVRHDAVHHPRQGRQAGRLRAALRQRLDRGLVQLSLRRPEAGQRLHQGEQSRDDGRPDRLVDQDHARVGAGRLG